MSVIIIGASGLVGSELTKLALESKEDVYVLVRKPLSFSASNLHQIIINFDEEDFSQYIPIDCRAGFCCLGTTMKQAGSKEAFRKVDEEYVLKFAEACQKKSVPHFAVISSLGADAASPFFYNKVKGEVETSLKELNFTSLAIFRPSLLLGSRPEKRLTENISAVVMNLLDFLIPAKYKGIQGAQVAKAMWLQSLQNDKGKAVIMESEKIRKY